MTDKEMAINIATAVLQFQMSKRAFESIVSLYRVSGRELEWKPMIENTTNDLLISKSFQERIVQIKSAFDATTDGEQLIRALHRELFDSSPLQYQE